MFSGLFAAYAVLSGQYRRRPDRAELFDLRNVFIETMCLLLSSYTCGLGALSAERRQPARFFIFAVLTFVLGAAFLFIEVSEFAGMVEQGRRALAQRLSVGLLHPGGHARRARHERADLRSSIWWPRSSLRACGPPCCGACCAGACSGTRWTSSGSACSRWST